jgi:acetyl esterase/lipase
LSLDYRKAPEFPYPYALNECYDVYSTIIASRGRCVGLSGEVIPKVVITADSAGGNLATGVVMMIIESGSTDTRQYQGQTSLPIPDGLILIYPGLDMNIGNWMSDEQMSLIKDRRMRKTNKNIIRRKSMQYTLAAGTPHQSDDEDASPPKMTSPPISGHENGLTALTDLSAPEFSTAGPPLLSPPITRKQERRPSSSHRPEPLKTRLAMSSMISYFNDRILTPEMMRAMIILYIGPHNRPDFSQDYLLSPILAPDSLLCQFPKTYFLTGERDPLVDDTVIFAGRLRRAKAALHHAEQASNVHFRKEFDDRDVVEVTLIPGISHGFLQFVGVFPEGWKYIHKCAKWIDEIFMESEQKATGNALLTPGGYLSGVDLDGRHERIRRESSGEEDMGLEMSMSKSSKGKDVAQERKRKEKLLKEEMSERRRRKQELGGRKKSMVSLASEDDLLGRRMLGLAGPLTGRGHGGDDD